MAGTHNFLCEQGATFTREITWLDSEGVPVNLTNYTARMQVRATASAASTLISLTSSGGDITLGGTAGTINITISATATAGVAAGCYVYDLELVDGTTVYRILQGDFTVDAEVTR
jgi:hypothetical protein